MKKQKLTSRNDQDYRLFALAERMAQDNPWVLLTQKDVTEKLNLEPQQVFRLFTRLHTQGRIQQLQRGLYMLPGRLPPGKLWKPSPYEALVAYTEYFKIQWQITGLAAFAHHGFSTQIAQNISVYNDSFSGEKELAGNQFYFIKVPKNRLGNAIKIPILGEMNIYFSSHYRSIFDAIFEASRFNTLPEAYVWLATLMPNEKALEEIIYCCLHYGNNTTTARVGYFLEKIGIEVEKLYKHFCSKKSKAFILFVPGARSGTVNKKWNIIENFSVDEIVSRVEVPDADE
jgi:predicted transcriptional regulator of viral defense system